MKAALWMMILLVCFHNESYAEKRYSDPDGCMLCHGLEGLEFIDEEGVKRVASIIKNHYYSSLHGSVPCKDCHRKIQDYPHRVENGYVDCMESCHVKEPSDGVAFTHKPVFEEFDQGVHSDGWHKDLAGGNRLLEMKEELNPSCRYCHSNTLYIPESHTEKFKEAFAHTETECGACHEGEVWLNQFGGHILRRFLGSRWTKEWTNQVCIDCHHDHDKMAKVKRKDPETGEEKPVSKRFIYAVDTYEKTLHSRILKTGINEGATCIDCHAPGGLHHQILTYTDKMSSVHENKVQKTCSQAGCHSYASHPATDGFAQTDPHDLSLLNMWLMDGDSILKNLTTSPWFISFWPLMLIGSAFFMGSILWLFIRKAASNKKADPIVGADQFEQIIIGRRGKKSSAKKKTPAKKTKATGNTENHAIEASTEEKSGQEYEHDKQK